VVGWGRGGGDGDGGLLGWMDGGWVEGASSKRVGGLVGSGLGGGWFGGWLGGEIGGGDG